ncbi:MAG: GTP cyclohydrolase, FolE2/MptA family, partial [Bdellovibrio sp.]
RSLARVTVQHRPEAFLEAFLEEMWIGAIEAILGTPVQEAVKRLDEQEFARRNAQNLMFCEDAARRIGGFLKSQSEVLAFSCSVFHLESLHAHNAVARLHWGNLQYPPLENSPLK